MEYFLDNKRLPAFLFALKGLNIYLCRECPAGAIYCWWRDAQNGQYNLDQGLAPG